MEIAEGSNRAQRLPAEQNLVFYFKHKDKEALTFFIHFDSGEMLVGRPDPDIGRKTFRTKRKDPAMSLYRDRNRDRKGDNLSKRTERALGTF